MQQNRWLIQSSGFTSHYIMNIISSLNELNVDWKDFGIIDNDITNLENILAENYNFIIRGGIKTLSLLQQASNILDLNSNLSPSQIKLSEIYLYKLKQSIDYDKINFDQFNYRNNSILLPLLNDDVEYYTVNDLLYSQFENEYFIKPSRDNKAFNGGIIFPDETLMNFLMRTPHQNIDKINDEIIMVSSVKKIKEEYRFFMFKDIILGSSRYMLNNNINPSSFVPQFLIDAAKEFGKLYNPADIYVMDLCTFENSKDIKIVEYNCWNCSGFYHSDIKSIIKQIDLIKSNHY